MSRTGIREAGIERSRHTELHLFLIVVFLIFLRIAWPGRYRRGLCTGCRIPFPGLFGLVSAAALALLRASENDIGEDDDDADILAPFVTSPASPPPSARSSADGGERRCCCLLGSGSGVTRNDGDPPRLPLSLSPSLSELSASCWSFLLLFAPLPFAKRDMGPVPPRSHCATMRVGQSSQVGRRGRIPSEPRSS